jgi:chitodextrinase
MNSYDHPFGGWFLSYKRVFVVFAVVLGLLFFGMQAQRAEAAINFAQSTSTNIDLSGAQTLTNSFASNVTAGDLILVAVQMYVADTFNTPTDTLGDSFIQAVESTSTPGGGVNTALYYAISNSGGADSVTVHFNNNSTRDNFAQYEYSGIASSSPLDAVASSSGSSASTTWHVVPISTTNTNDLLFISGGSEVASSTLTAGSGYTMRENRSYSTGDKTAFAQEDQIVSGAGLRIGTMTSSPALAYSMLFAAFKAPSDTTPPSVTWISPPSNTTVSSTITLMASSTDNIAVSSTAFYEGPFGGAFASSTLIGSTSTPSGSLYSISWNSTNAANGTTTLWVLSTDTSNNTSTASTTVIVKNPPVISAISATTTSTASTIAWTTNEAASSQVSYGLTSAYGSSTVTSTLTTSHSVQLSGLTNNLSYHYQILSTDAQGNTATTTDGTFFIDTLPPSTPGGLSATSTASSTINLSWASSTDNIAVTGYDIYRNGVKVATSSGASYLDTGLFASTTYSYYIDSFDAPGNTSPTSTTVTASTQPGRSFYIDYVSGNDSNNGSSKTTPWQHAPGMVGCTSVCASTTPQPADNFIFKGGVTWPNSNFTWTISWSGSIGNPIYFGVDKTWYTGSSWTRPVFDLQSTTAGSKNIVVDLQTGGLGISYVTLDNLEMVNFRWTGSPTYGNAIGINLETSQNITLENVYFHSWTHDNPGGCTSGNCDAMKVVVGSTSSPYNPGSIINDLTCDGAPSGTDSGMCTYAVPAVENSTAQNMSNGFLLNGATVTFAGNTVGPINQSYDTGNHENCVETTGASTVYFSNNLIHDCTAVSVFTGGGIAAPETDYIWNNIIYNSVPGPVYIDTSPVATGSAYLYNNTFVATSSGSCVEIVQRSKGDLANFVEENNNCISDNGTATHAMVCDKTWNSGGCAGATTETLATNVVMSHAAAASQGFTAGNSYSETSVSNSTVQIATNLTSLCSGSLASLCTSFNGLTRPASAAWDAGAYQLDTIPPSVPTGLAATPVSTSQINLSWTASTDNVAVAGYDILRNNTKIATTSVLAYVDTGLSANTLYSYAVDAFDAVGNASATSTSVSATTASASSGGGGGSSIGVGGGGGGGGSYIPPATTPATPSAPTAPTSRGSTSNLSGLLALVTDVRSLSLQMFLSANNGRTLTIGFSGQDVWALQVYLIMNNALSPAGNRLTNPTGYFGILTRNALALYQAKVGISPASGLLGSKTHAYLESIGR